MKIIVTGGAGFIGSNFVQHMVNKYPEYTIINLDLLTYAGNLENLKPVEDKPNYRFVRGDIADRTFIFDLFEKEKPDMNKPKLLFSILTIFFAALGLTGILPYNISLPVMFIFLGLALLVNAKESLDKGRQTWPY